MAKFAVMLVGENFLLDFDGSVQRMGFYVTRYVEADDPHQAELTAVDLIREDPKLKGVPLNSRDDPPRLHVEEISTLDSFDGVTNRRPGFVFFPDTEDPDA
jgi:hypothetical protein